MKKAMFSILTITILFTAVNVFAATYNANGRWHGSSPDLRISRPDCQVQKNMRLLVEISQWGGNDASISINGITTNGRVSGSTYSFQTNQHYQGVNHVMRGSFTLSSKDSGRGSFSWRLSNNQGTCYVNGNIVLTKSSIRSPTAFRDDDD